jgi:hypothetical protein
VLAGDHRRREKELTRNRWSDVKWGERSTPTIGILDSRRPSLFVEDERRGEHDSESELKKARARVAHSWLRGHALSEVSGNGGVPRGNMRPSARA